MKYTEDKILSNGSVIHWSKPRIPRRYASAIVPQVEVTCGICEKMRLLPSGKAGSSSFSGLCPGCRCLEKEDIILPSGSIVHLSRPRKRTNSDTLVEVTCGVCKITRYIQNGSSQKSWTGLCQLCANRALSLQHLGNNHPSWSGGRLVSKDGYIQLHHSLLSPDELELCKGDLNNGGYVWEHRLVMAKQVNRSLTKQEIVHHLNGVKDDNRSCNLRLLTKESHKTNNRIISLQAEVKRLQVILGDHFISY